MVISEQTGDGDRLDFYQSIPSKTGLYFIYLVGGGFGLIFTAGALTRNMRDADDWVLLLLGLVAIAATIRLYQISNWPSFSLTHDELIVRRWIGTRQILYSNIQAISEYSQWTKPARTQQGRKIAPILIHYVSIDLQNGTNKTFPLPSYATNQGLLKALAHRTNLEIESRGIRGTPS